jgi:GT2 family glycosyltransferase
MSDRISVVILNWNGREMVKNCLDSVRAQEYEDKEVIVVDNGSHDGSVELIRNEYRDVILLEQGTNLGFGGGNNVGIARATGSYIAILNNDAEMERTCLTEMKRAMDKSPEYGACASKIYLKHEDNLLDAAGIVVYPDGLSIGRGRLEKGTLFDTEEDVFFPSGCCCLLKKEMLEDIKVRGEYYDEAFFAYGDDTDLGWRARLRGWRCIYAPRAKAYHLHSASSGNYSPFKAFLVERNRLWLAVKSFPLPLLLYGQCFTLLRYACQAYGALRGMGASGAFTRQRSRWELVNILLKVYCGAFMGLPGMVRKRREIQKRKVVTVTGMFYLLKLYGIRTRAIAFKG